MKTLRTLWAASLVFALASPAMAAATAAATAELAVGDRAPAFSLAGSDGRRYRLADLLNQGGSRGIVLAFFPKAFTPG